MAGAEGNEEMTEEDILRRLIELELILRPLNYKELYAERDELTLALVRAGFTEGKSGEQTLTLRDNYEDKNCAWTMTPIRRYEIKIKERK